MSAIRRNLIRRLAAKHQHCLFRLGLKLRRLSTQELGMLLYGDEP